MPASSGDIDGMLPTLQKLAEVLKDDPWMCEDPRLKPILQGFADAAAIASASPRPAEDPKALATDGSSSLPAVPSPAQLAAAAAEEPAPNSSTPGAALTPPGGSGCYLFASVENSGTLFAWWSETPIDGAIAYMKPRKNVPKFKFSAKGGKNELCRGMRGPLVKNYYRGWVDFIKNFVKAYDGSIVLYPPKDAFPSGSLDVGVFLSMPDSSVKKLAANEEMASLDGVKAVVCADFNCDLFTGVSSMTTPMFLNKGNQAGGSTEL